MYRPDAGCPVRCRGHALGALIALALAAGAACCAASPGPCASDGDCPGALTCDQGGCLDPRRAPVPDLRPRRVAIVARADATVLSSTCCRTAAFGDHDVLVVGGASGGGEYRTYLAFDLDHIEGGEVVRATLRLAGRPRWSRGGSPLELLVLAAGGRWSEGSLTWAGQPGATGAPLGAGLLRPDVARSTSLDVTPLVGAWISGSIQNTGMVLRARSERPEERVAFASSEAADPRTRPLLEVEVR